MTRSGAFSSQLIMMSCALTFRDFVPRLELMTLFWDILGIWGFSEKFENVQN